MVGAQRWRSQPELPYLIFLYNAAVWAAVGNSALAMALIILPLALVLVPISIDVGTLAVHFPVNPVSDVFITIRVGQCTKAIDASIVPLRGVVSDAVSSYAVA